MKRRFLSLFMAVVLCFSTLPAAVLAENAETEPNTVQETEPLPAVQNSEENGIAVQISGYTAKIGNIQYATLTEAFDAANTYNGATIELLKNVELSSEADSITVSSNITLDTNGYAIQTEYANITIKRSGKLTIKNQAETSETLEIPIFIENNAALEVSADTQQSLSYICLSGNGTLICTTGTIGRLELLDSSTDYDVTLADSSGHCTISSISAENDAVTVGNLLNKKHSGLALRAGDEQIPREQKIKSMPDSSNQNLWVGACDFHEYTSSEDSTCKYCGKALSSGMQAMISESGRYYDTIAAALNGAEDGQTIVLLTTITEHFRIGKNITIDLNGNDIEHNVTINSNSTLTLTGSGMINVVQSGTALDGVVGGALNVLSDKVFVGVLAIGQKPNPTTNLSHGMFGKIELNTDLNMLANELLAEGYAFASSGLGEVEDGYVHSLHNIKIVEHVHDTTKEKCQCGFEFKNVPAVKCTEHADSDGDGKCDYCNGELAAKITSNSGVNSLYTDLQDAINVIDDSKMYIITLLADANGSYTVEKSRNTTFRLNNKTINEIVFSNNAKIVFNDNGKVNSVIFRGNSAGFSAGNPLVTINKLTIADGASWSSILPPNSIYGYKVYSDNTYKWYDRNTAAGMASMSNVKVASLPVTRDPELMINSEKLAEESSVSVYKELSFSFNSFVTNGCGGKGALFIKKEGASAPTEIPADGDSNDYVCPSRTFDLSEIGTYEVWATVTKEGYTRTSKKYTINVEANLKDAEVTLKQSEFTYTPEYNTGAEEFTAEIDSVKLFGNAIPSDAYTVSGDKGTDARDYALTITANDTSVYTGSKSVDWKILPRELDGIKLYPVKRYDGTTSITLENSIFGNTQHEFLYNAEKSSFWLTKDTNYTITVNSAVFDKADAETWGDVTYTIALQNPNFTFKDENGSNTNTKTFSNRMQIAAAELPADCAPQRGNLTVRNRTEHTYTLDVSQLLSKLPDGLDYGTKSYTVDNTTLSEPAYYDKFTVSIDENGILTLPFKATDSSYEGNVCTVRITVHTNNYDDIDVFVNVSAKNKTVPTGNPALSDNGTITYGEKISKITMSGTLRDEVGNADVSGTFAWDAPDTAPDAGSYEAAWTFTPLGSNAFMYETASGKSTVTVNKAELAEGVDYTAPAAIEGLVYNGTSQTLHTSGSVSGSIGTIKFTASPNDEASWDIKPLTGLNAAESYAVYYKVFGDKNHNDTNAIRIDNCTIAKRPVTITNKQGDDGYKTTYMYGNSIFDPQESEFEIVGSEDGAAFSYEWTDPKPEMYSELGDYEVKVIIGATNNTAGAVLKVPVKIVRKTGSNYEDMGGYDYPVYNNTGTVSYEVDFTPFTNIDTDSLEITDYAIYVRDGNNNYINYDPNTCDFGINVTESAKKGMLHIELSNLNKSFGYACASITVLCSDKHYEKIAVPVRLKPTPKEQKTLGVTMSSSTYGDVPNSPVYTAPEGTLKSSVTYAKKDGTTLTEAPTTFGDYTVTVVCETKDTVYTGSADYAIGKRPLGNVTVTLDQNSFVYNGTEQKPAVTVTFNGAPLTEGTDYTVVYPNDMTNAGAKEIKLSGIGNFSGETAVSYSVEKNTAAPDVTLSAETFTYDGKAKEPTAAVVSGGKTLELNKDYEISYSNNTNAGTASITITSKGNYGFNEVKKDFTINKAKINVKPKDITKVYGDEVTFELESASNLITDGELAEFAKTAAFTSDGAPSNAPANANGYEISVQLSQNETDNLIFEVSAGILKVEKAPLTIKVKDVSREYGAENPVLEAEYSGFKNNEDESVLNGVLTLSYDSDINAQKEVGSYIGAAKAEGLTSDNYEITYVNGNVEITKIPVNTSAGAARKSYLIIVLDRAVEGLTEANFTVKDSDNKTVAFKSITAAADNKSYILNGSFTAGTEYTVTVTLSGTAADATHSIVNSELAITPVSTSNDGGGSSGGTSRYTVSFNTNGGSDVSNQTVTKNSVIKEPTAPTKDGFDFAGWYTDKELKTKYDFSEKVTKSITLYAAWTEKDNSANQIILTIGDVSALVFGTVKANDVAPKIVNDRTMLPARFVAENLGAAVEWNGDKQLVTIKGKHLKTGEDITILITIGAETAMVNDKEITLDSPAFIENDRTYTPVRFISEELGASVEWAEAEQKVIITK